MNICILFGKIVSKIEFKFIINSKNKSIAYFNMELLNKSIVEVRGFNNIADYIYRNFSTEDFICICGYIENDTIIINEISNM